jgi:hypothetical protein
MYDLQVPNVAEIIKSIIKKDTGQDVKLIPGAVEQDYSLWVNQTTVKTYLVQVSRQYDLFGYLDVKEDYPEVDAYIYIGPQYMYIFFADDLVADYKAGNWKMSGKDLRIDSPNTYWTSAMALLDRIGGLCVDYHDGTVVERNFDE